MDIQAVFNPFYTEYFTLDYILYIQIYLWDILMSRTSGPRGILSWILTSIEYLTIGRAQVPVDKEKKQASLYR